MPLLITNKWLWLSAFCLCVINITAFALSRATVDLTGTDFYLKLGLSFAGFWVLMIGLARRGNLNAALLEKLQAFCEGMSFMCFISLNVPVLNHLTMMIPFPFQDDMLAGWDAALGLNWLAYFELIHRNPSVITVFDHAYAWLSMVGLLGMGALIVMGDWPRTRFYMEVFFYTAITCVVLGAAFPALAAVERFIPDLSVYGNFVNPPGVYHIPYFEDLRTPVGDVSIRIAGLPGLVTFPSYHTASGVLLAICFFRTPLFWPMTLYATIMIASSPIYGGHYFIDIFAGALFAVGAVLLLLRREAYRGLFHRSRTTLKSHSTPKMA